jgi:hypothetical protein
MDSKNFHTYSTFLQVLSGNLILELMITEGNKQKKQTISALPLFFEPSFNQKA